MKNSTKRKWIKGISVRAAALTFFATILLVYGVGMYLFSDFVFLQDNREAVTPSAVFLEPEGSLPPMLVWQTHREAARTPGEKAVTAGYTALPPDFADSMTKAEKHLREAGVPLEIRYTWSTEPAGELLYLEYAGTSDETGYYVNPAVPVTLVLSGKKAEMPEDTGKNRVYLTFDDGPTAYTEEILDILGRYGVPAAFFTLWTSVEKYPATARRITEDGHLLASHGNTHKYESIYASAGALLRDVQAWQKIVTDAGILPPSDTYHFRFPGGSVSSYFGSVQRQNMIDGLHGMGFRIYDWNILTNDGLLGTRPAEMTAEEYWKQTFLETWENCTSETRIILLHDSTRETTALLPWLIRYVLDAGYTFVRLDQLDGEYYMR
ncbi:MAG: polysaccharide deacetylase family protein [Clostridia bacterium]|nr:polysaccharide deacetylase family protein [Clostridia bacterium]